MATKYKMAANIQLQTLVEWAKQIPHFLDLAIDDQVSYLPKYRVGTKRPNFKKLTKTEMSC